MDSRLLFNSFIYCLLLLQGACSESGMDSNIDEASPPGITIDESLQLPEGFTMQNIQAALELYINDRLSLYPVKENETPSEKDFDPYIGETVDVVVRVYGDDSGVYEYEEFSSAWFVRQDG